MALNRNQLEGAIFGILQTRYPGRTMDQHWYVAKEILAQVEHADPLLAVVIDTPPPILPATVPETAAAP